MLESELRQRIVKVMQGWVGLRQSDGSNQIIIDTYNRHWPLARGYQLRRRDAWCAGTVSAAAIRTGLTRIIPTEVSCGHQIALLQRMGAWQERDSYKPRPGDLVYYYWKAAGQGDCTGWPDHVGMVADVRGGTIYAIEGNKGGAVGWREFPVDWRYIRGFGTPDYKTEAAVRSVDELAALGVLNSAGYWKKVLIRRQVRFLDDLICKASGAIRRAGNRTGTVEEGVQRLMRAGVVNSPDYWLSMAGKVPNVGELIKALGGSL